MWSCLINREELIRILTPHALAEPVRSPFSFTMVIEGTAEGLRLVNMPHEFRYDSVHKLSVRDKDPVIVGCNVGELLKTVKSITAGQMLELQIDKSITFQSPMMGLVEFEVVLGVDPIPPAVISWDGHVELPGAELREAIRCVVLAISDDAMRPVLTHVLIEMVEGDGTYIVATNGHILVQVQLPVSPIEGGLSVLVPGVMARFVANLIPDQVADLTFVGRPILPSVELHWANDKIGWAVDSHLVSGGRGQGQFPSYRNVMPDIASNVLLVHTDELRRLYRQVRGSSPRDAIFEMSLPIEIELSTLECKWEHGQTRLIGHYKGELERLCISPKYIDVLVKMVPGELRIVPNADATLAIIESPAHPDFYGLLALARRPH